MTRYLLTLYERDEDRRRHYKFPDDVGFIFSGGEWRYRETVSASRVHEMLSWLDESILGKSLAAYGIAPVVTDLRQSSVIIEVKNSDVLDDLKVTAMLSCDATITPVDAVKPRQRDQKRFTNDRYAR